MTPTDQAIADLDAQFGFPMFASTIGTIVGLNRTRAVLAIIGWIACDLDGLPRPDPLGTGPFDFSCLTTEQRAALRDELEQRRTLLAGEIAAAQGSG